MALEIVWTERASAGYDRVIKDLEERWTEKEIRNFVQHSEQFFELLRHYPEMLEKSSKQKYLRRGPINKYTILTYRIKPRKKQVEFINIRFARGRA